MALPGLLTAAAWGYSSDGSSVSRSCESAFALTNTPVMVTITFSNGGADVLRGFFFGAQVPSRLAVTPVGVSVNGTSASNVTLESGLDGDTVPGCTPWRWRLETPVAFAELDPLAPQAIVEIRYALTSAQPGGFSLGQFDWAGYWPAGTNGSFGYDEPAQQQTVTFLVSTNPPELLAQPAPGGIEVWLAGDAGVRYVLETSTSFAEWMPVATNAGSFSYTATNALNPGGSFYRGRIWLGGP